MLDPGWLRRNFEEAKLLLHDRCDSKTLDAFIDTDNRRRAAVTEIETLKFQRNQLSAAVAKARRAGQDAGGAMERSKATGSKIKQREDAVKSLDAELLGILDGIPNIPHESVPAGKDESGNVEISKWGALPDFDFEPKPHWDIGVALGIVDFERAAKITGARFAVYRDAGAKLERALINFMLDVHTEQHGYSEILPPFIVNSNSLYGTGQLPKFADDLFKLENTDYWLTPTAEVQLTNLFAGETLGFDNLPIKLAAYTPCFRREAGSYGRDVRGIIRQHQFQKVELVKFALPEQSYDELESLTADAEDILRRLELPYRKIVLAAGDTSFSSAKTYDLEVWLPGLGEYKEISSCSNFETFQARRAGIRFRDPTAKKGKPQPVHTLNGSGLAVGRTWLAIVENYQQSDGSVKIPEALQPYLNAERIATGGRLV